MGFKERLAAEIARYQLSEFEQEALSAYPDRASPELMKAFRGGVMVFHNILSELFSKGLRLRIVPKGSNLTDLLECSDLKKYKTKDGRNYYDVNVGGCYRCADRIIIIKEECLLSSKSVNQRYRELIHEFAHAIWDLILWEEERAYIAHLYVEERKKSQDTGGYRMKDVLEFFAENFLYYVTPYRQSRILGISEKTYFGLKITEIERENVAPNKETLKGLNVKVFEFLESKFKGIIEPELVMPKPDRGDEERFDMWSDKGLYLPLIHTSSLNY